MDARANSIKAELPRFTEHGEHEKNDPLSAAEVKARPLSRIERWLLHQAGEGRGLRVLDFGCGKGAFVANLRTEGFEAYGADISEGYLRSAASYFGPREDYPAVSQIRDGRTVFPDGFFDVVFTNQVFEHVEDAQGAVAEIARVTRPGGVGLHILPSRFCLVEPHMYLPLVHWLPKGSVQRLAIRALLGCGAGARFFAELSLKDRTSIFDKFSRTETFYRSLAEYRRLFGAKGMSVSNVVRRKLCLHSGIVGRVARLAILGAAGAHTYSMFHQLYFVTRKA